MPTNDQRLSAMATGRMIAVVLADYARARRPLRLRVCCGCPLCRAVRAAVEAEVARRLPEA